ncbi:TrbG/VirB9 family P-type conjugative transfer protein, partial [Pseudomonas sp. EA_15y_Pfl1_P102]|uniref:TrbG/VirB9 family P-type conjugative transfer protein n=1 Tax=Pseudomonas sp. EA_15y_Pfl1_P102 TaxID=3088685 RepID=UPI0030DBC1F5
TRIVLEQDEKIEIPVVGLSSDCKSENDEWCISAIQGSNQIFVRPRDNATRNNMELHTNKRDYSFAFEVVDEIKISRGKRADDVPFFRVVFDYPRPKPLGENMSGADRAAAVNALLQRVDVSAARPVPSQVDPDYGMTPVQRLKAEGIE